MIVNPDGTMRRITNWDILTKQEQESTWRIISARNKKRLDALKRKNGRAGVELERQADPEF